MHTRNLYKFVFALFLSVNYLAKSSFDMSEKPSGEFGPTIETYDGIMADYVDGIGYVRRPVLPLSTFQRLRKRFFKQTSSINPCTFSVSSNVVVPDSSSSILSPGAISEQGLSMVSSDLDDSPFIAPSKLVHMTESRVLASVRRAHFNAKDSGPVLVVPELQQNHSATRSIIVVPMSLLVGQEEQSADKSTIIDPNDL